MKEQISESVDKSLKPSSATIRFPTFERILVAYDGMQMSKRALGYAAYISKISNPEIVVINVIKATRDSALPLSLNVDLEANEEQIDFTGSSMLVREVTKETVAACKAASITGKIICKIHGGNPAIEIINLSNFIHFDLIIMGSRRIASRIQGVGSTTRKIAATLNVPILIVQRQPKYKDEW
jgi:nucleotide-binding universal stress UspA family protein